MDERKGFRVVVRPLRLILGALLGLGYLILLQQYGITTLTTGKLILFVVIGLVIGIALPTLATLIPHRPKAPAPPMEEKGGSP